MDLRRIQIATSHGLASFIGIPGPRDHVRVIIHGAGRRAETATILPWADDGALLAELPGHGEGPMIRGGVLEAADSFRQAIARRWPDVPVTVMGESLGALVALAMGADRTIALDPAMEPTPEVDKVIESGRLHPWAVESLRRNYWGLLDSLRRPVDVVCASGTILSAASVKRLERHPMVRLSRLEGWHLLLDERPDECRALLNLPVRSAQA